MFFDSWKLHVHFKARSREHSKSPVFWMKVSYFSVYTHPGPSGGYPDPMSYMMDGNQMMHRPPGDAAFHQGYHYPPAEYYPHHL
jgi:hypothetical protein